MSQSDSRKILDTDGAEKLKSPEELMCCLNGHLIKAQQPFIDFLDLLNVIDYISEQKGHPHTFFLEESQPEEDAFDPMDRDEYFEEAARLIVMHQQGSTALIQRKLNLGYNRVGRIIDQLEAAGIVGRFEGSKAREVLIPDEYSLEQYLGTMDFPGSPYPMTDDILIEQNSKQDELSELKQNNAIVPVILSSIPESKIKKRGILSSIFQLFK